MRAAQLQGGCTIQCFQIKACTHDLDVVSDGPNETLPRMCEDVRLVVPAPLPLAVQRPLELCSKPVTLCNVCSHGRARCLPFFASHTMGFASPGPNLFDQPRRGICDTWPPYHLFSRLQGGLIHMGKSWLAGPINSFIRIGVVETVCTRGSTGCNGGCERRASAPC